MLHERQVADVVAHPGVGLVERAEGVRVHE